MKQKSVTALLKKHPIRLQKKLGQNFLLDPNLMDKILDALDLYPDEDVLEIGSGLGVLTQKMAKQTLEVLAVEKDKRLVAISRREFEKQKNIKFLEGDFLALNLEQILKPYRLPIKVIGNIPYYISSRILFKLLENRALFQLAVLTVQKEVARRMVASPGSKDYGVLTVLLNSQVQCETLFDIGPQAFFPPPEVISTVVRISFPKDPLYRIANLNLFKRVVRQAFGQRRKTIRNTLKNLLKNTRIKPWDACQIDANSRPEEIPILNYVALANFLNPLI